MSTHYIRAAGTYSVTMPRATSRDATISYRALGVLGRLLGNAEGYDMPATALARGDGREGRDAIRAALGELTRAGYLVRVHTRNDGKWTGQTVLVYDTPGHTAAECADFPAPGNPAPRKPVAGNAAPKSSRGRATPNSSSSSAQPAAAPKRGQEPDRRKRRHACVTYWTADEVADIDSLCADFGADAVSATARAMRAAGTDPLRSLVERELLAARRRQVKADRDAARHARTVPPPAQRTAATDDAAEAARAQLARLHLA